MENELVWIELTTDSRPPEYILLQPGLYPAREGQYHGRICSFRDLDAVLGSAIQSQIVAVDFETKGNDYSDGIEVVGIGLAWDRGSAYFDWNELHDLKKDQMLDFLMSHQGLVAHNVYFDGGVALTLVGQHLNWKACTYALLAMTANDGHPGQYWGLKDAMTTFLGWTNSNEHELDEWLVVNGYYKGNRRINNNAEYLSSEYRAGNLTPEKGEMWRAPMGILGKYCCLDAEATYLLYTELLAPLLEQFPGLKEFYTKYFLPLIDILIEQKMHGIPMDRPGLLARKSILEQQVQELESNFRTHPEVDAEIYQMEQLMVGSLLLSQPAMLKKNGEMSKNWIKWKERLEEAKSGSNPDYKFNLQSGPQMRELFYKRLDYPVRIETEKGEAGVGIKALKHMGEPGQILIERMWAVKELSYIDKYLELTEHRDTIHPSFRTPGTVTGRLSSKEPNMQQIPKSKAMMSLFVARPDTVWVDLDFSALEPVVVTEFSQDPNMLAIYGNGRPANDIYLFVGAHIPGMAEKILATGYDPYNPTREGLARAKKECKHERSICKTVTLACQYGAGVKKVMQTLENDDIFLPYAEVAKIHSTYWSVFQGVKEFSRELQNQWRINGGYILNGVGRPMSVPGNMTQDLLNRFVQSTGHDILVRYISILTDILDRRQMPWRPIILDFHDATTIEVPEEWAEHTVQVFDLAMVELNNQLQGTIQLRGVPVIGRSLAEVKEPEN